MSETLSTERARVMSVVSRCRRRWHVVTFARAFLLALVISLVAATLWVIAVARANDAWRATAAAVSASLVAAAIATARRRASSSDVARLIDRRLALQDRVAAALEFSGHDDPVSRLVVADAARQVRHVQPRLLFPFHAGAPLAAAALMGTLFAVAAMYRSPAGDASSVAGDAAMGIAQSPATGNRRADASTGDAATPMTDAPPPSDGAAVPAPSESAVAGAEDTRVTRDSDATRPGDRETAPSESTATRDDVMRDAVAEASSSPAAGGGANRGDGQGAGSLRPGAEASARAGGGSAGGRDGGARNMAMAGGVGAGGPASRAAEVTGGRAADARVDAATLTAATARAEAALRRGEVPPAMHDVVRRYFLELQRRTAP